MYRAAVALSRSKLRYTGESLQFQRHYAAKKTYFGGMARREVLTGVRDVAACVQVTMGPKGRHVIIEQAHGSPKVTKDGVTVAKAISFEEKMRNIGASLVKCVASKTNDVAGDGTTCATVLTHAIFGEGCKSVAAGMNAMDLRRGMSMAVEHVLEYLKANARLISTPEEVAQVATISANGDTTIGDLVATAMAEVGKDGAITVTDGKTFKDELTVVKGMKLDKGYVSPYFITNAKSQKCELENTFVLIHEKKISSLHTIIPVLEIVAKARRALLIIAEDVDSEVLATLVVNKLRGGFQVAAIKSPMFGENRKNTLHDIAVLTGGKVISEEMGLKLETVQMDMLGTAKKITVSKNDTIILEGGGDKEDIEERATQIREEIPVAISDYDKNKLEERLARLSGGVAVIKAGGGSETEVSEKKDRITDAVNATRAAVQEGIVPGGGAALLHASKELSKIPTSNLEQKMGVQIIQNAIKVPAFTIAANAGVEGAIVVGKLLDEKNQNVGYDAAKDEYVDMFKAGIIDPVKVIRTALSDAASVSSLLTTTEAVITEIPQPHDKKEDLSAGMGGMGGENFEYM